MINTISDDSNAALRQAMNIIDKQIKDLQKKRNLIATLVNESDDLSDMQVAPAPTKKRFVSEATKAKLRAAAKSRWDKERKSQKTKSPAGKAQSKGYSAKGRQVAKAKS